MKSRSKRRPISNCISNLLTKYFALAEENLQAREKRNWVSEASDGVRGCEEHTVVSLHERKGQYHARERKEEGQRIVAQERKDETA